MLTFYTYFLTFLHVINHAYTYKKEQVFIFALTDISVQKKLSSH